MNNPWKDLSWSLADPCCEVRARGRVIRYRCAGNGRPVILLRSAGPLAHPWRELVAALERSYRVIVPEAPPVDTDVTDWLDAFLEGLGGSNVRILAADRFCLPAFELALSEADQIARLVLVPLGRGREIVVGGVVETSLERTRVPIQILHQGEAAGGELVTRVTRFMGAAGAAPLAALARSAIA